MCGIVGYAGSKQAAPILLDGLSRLEYRGYDSAGLCVFSEGELKLAKSKGRLAVLRTKTENGATLPGYLGIGHTRWATHGAPSDENAHPQLSTNGSICIVHNGIIENFLPLKEFLLKQGKTFRSETDTEVIANLLEYYYEQENDLMKAVRLTLGRIEGSYALGILCADRPDSMIAEAEGQSTDLRLRRGRELHRLGCPGHPAVYAQRRVSQRRRYGRVHEERRAVL